MTSSELCWRRVDDGPLGVELLGFHRRAAEGRRGRPREMLLPPVPERLRNGDAKVRSWFPPPVRALRRLHDGLVTWTLGPEFFDGSIGRELGEGMRGLAELVMGDVEVPGTVDGLAYDVV